MTQQRRGGLGRGLAALIPTGPDEGPRLGSDAADVILGPRGDGPRTTPPGHVLVAGEPSHRIHLRSRQVSSAPSLPAVLRQAMFHVKRRS